MPAGWPHGNDGQTLCTECHENHRNDAILKPTDCDQSPTLAGDDRRIFKEPIIKNGKIETMLSYVRLTFDLIPKDFYLL